MPNSHNARRTAVLVLALVFLQATAFVLAHDPPAGGVSIASCGRKRSDGGSACVLAPEMTEGPYYWNDFLYRRNITEGRPGVPLLLNLKVVNVRTCEPVPDAIVDVWHCDALGLYSHYTSAGVGGTAGGGGSSSSGSTTDTTTFLRGVQLTDAAGYVTFASLYPGFYQGRVTHIHVKVHLNSSVVHTGQLFFEEELNDAVYQLAAYSQNTAQRTALASDGIYTGTTDASAGLFEDVQQLQPSLGISGGLVASLTLGVDPTATGNDGVGLPGSMGPQPGGGRPGTRPNSTNSGDDDDDDGDDDDDDDEGTTSALSSVAIISFSLVAFASIIGGLIVLKLRYERAGYEAL